MSALLSRLRETYEDEKDCNPNLGLVEIRLDDLDLLLRVAEVAEKIADAWVASDCGVTLCDNPECQRNSCILQQAVRALRGEVTE